MLDRELYRELRRFLLSKEFSEFEAKHIPPESYMTELEGTYERFAGLVEPAIKPKSSFEGKENKMPDKSKPPHALRVIQRYLDRHSELYPGLTDKQRMARGIADWASFKLNIPPKEFAESEETSNMMELIKARLQANKEIYSGMTEPQRLSKAIQDWASGELVIYPLS
jgi:hypothetical protein